MADLRQTTVCVNVAIMEGRKNMIYNDQEMVLCYLCEVSLLLFGFSKLVLILLSALIAH